MKIFTLLLVFVAVLGFALQQPEEAQAVFTQKIDQKVLDEIAENSGVAEILVLMTEQADLTAAKNLSTKLEKNSFVYESLVETAKLTQSDLIKGLDELGVEYRSFYVMNMLQVKTVDRELLKSIAARDDVAKIYANPNIYSADPSPGFIGALDEEDENTARGIEANVSYINANRVWTELEATGQGIVVAGQDTGIEWEHPALANSYRGGNNGVATEHDYSWHDAIKLPIAGGNNPCGYDTAAPCDDDAHGTHTLGTIVGDDGMGNQIGVAPGASWIGCRNMDEGTGRPTTYIDCFEFFMAPYPHGANPQEDGDPAKAPHVMNNSWGCPESEECYADVLLQILRNLKAAGIYVVVAAGNDGPGCSTIKNTPAWHTEDSFAVGAVSHSNGKIASFSSRGPSTFDGGLGPDITAPGVNIRSSIPGGSYSGFFWSGTSMASPHIVGVVALMWSANPELIGNIDLTTEILRGTARPVNSGTCMDDQVETAPNNTYGYGIVDAYAAVTKAKSVQAEK